MADETGRYSKSGVDLLKPPILNPNPWDILPINGHPVSATYEKWQMFYYWLFPSTAERLYNELYTGEQKQDRSGNITINRTTSDIDINNTDFILDSKINLSGEAKKFTDKKIEEFNKYWFEFGRLNPSPHRGEANPLDGDDIVAIQKFTQITDPTVIVDGWLGTQTLQMYYPQVQPAKFKGYFKLLDSDYNQATNRFETNRTIIPDPSLYIPCVWGKYRFVVESRYWGVWPEGTRETNIQYKDRWNNIIFFFTDKLIPYNPEIYKYASNGIWNLDRDPTGTLIEQRPQKPYIRDSSGLYFPIYTVKEGEHRGERYQLAAFWKDTFVNASGYNWTINGITKTANYNPGTITNTPVGILQQNLTPSQINGDIRRLVDDQGIYGDITKVTKNIFR